MANVKITKTDRFSQLREFVSSSYTKADKAEIISFIDNEMALLAKKASRSSSTPTKGQVENAGIKDAILAYLATVDSGVTISQMMAEAPALVGYSNQKLSALTKQLVDEGKVSKTVEKKKSYFSLVKAEEVSSEDVEEEADVSTDMN